MSKIIANIGQQNSDVDVSKDGSRIVSGTRDSDVRIWDKDGVLLQELKGHTGWVTSVAWSPLGDKIVSGAWESIARVWDSQTGALVQELKGHTGGVTSVAWSPQGDKIVTGSEDNTVRVWDSRTGKSAHVLRGHTDVVRSVAWSPQGDKIVSGSDDKSVRVWDSRTGNSVHVLEGHTGWVTSVAWSLQGDKIVSAGAVCYVRVWDSQSGRLIWKSGIDKQITSVSFSPDGSRIASGSSDARVYLWDTASGTLLKMLNGHTECVFFVSWTADGSKILSGSTDNTVRMWQEIQHTSLKFKSKKIRTNERSILTSHFSAVPCVAWAESGVKLTAVSRKGILDVYDVQKKVLSSARTHRKLSCVTQLGSTTIIGSDDGMTLWKTKNNLELQYILDGHKDDVIAVSTTLTNTGQYIASISRKKLLIHKMYDDGPPVIVTTTSSFEGDSFTTLDWYKGHLLIASSRGLVFSYKIKTRTYDNTLDFPPGLYCIRWDPSGQRYAIGGKTYLYLRSFSHSCKNTQGSYNARLFRIMGSLWW